MQGAEYQLRLSLFDATYHHFFGRTWRSSWRAAGAAPPRSARATFNEVRAAGGLGKHSTKPFSLPALPDLLPGVHPGHCPFIKLYVWFIEETGMLGFLDVPPCATCCVQSWRQRAVFLHKWEGKEGAAAHPPARRFSPLIWGLNSPEAVLPSAADTSKPGCPLMGRSCCPVA